MLRLNSHTSHVLRPCHRLLVYWVNDTLSSAEVMWFQIMIMYNSLCVSLYEPGIDLEGYEIRTHRISPVARVVTATGVDYLRHGSQKLICSIDAYFLSYLQNSWLEFLFCLQP